MDWNNAIALAKELGANSWADVEEMLEARPTYVDLDRIPDLIFAACKQRILDRARIIEEERIKVAGLVKMIDRMEPF